MESFDLGGSTLRAALSRMVAAGDLRRTDNGYRLSDRLLERQRRQDESVQPRTRPWDGDWSWSPSPRPDAALPNGPSCAPG